LPVAQASRQGWGRFTASAAEVQPTTVVLVVAHTLSLQPMGQAHLVKAITAVLQVDRTQAPAAVVQVLLAAIALERTVEPEVMAVLVQ
jgi:hypothetical protein